MHDSQATERAELRATAQYAAAVLYSLARDEVARRRFWTFGVDEAARLLVVAHTLDGDRIRMISARIAARQKPATRKPRRKG